MKKVLTIFSLFFAITLLVVPTAHAESVFDDRAVVILDEPTSNYSSMCGKCRVKLDKITDPDARVRIILPDESVLSTDNRTLNTIAVEIANSGYFDKIASLGNAFVDSQKGKILQKEIMQLLISKIIYHQLEHQLSVQ